MTGPGGAEAGRRAAFTRWADRAVLLAAWVTVGGIVLAGALILWLRHTTGDIAAPAPNPAAYARSAPVRSADAADQSWLGRQFAGVREKAQPGAAGPPAGRTELEYSWAQRGDRVNLARELGAVPSFAAPDRNTYLQVSRPSQAAILGHLTPAHSHLLIISITADYAAHPAA